MHIKQSTALIAPTDNEATFMPNGSFVDFVGEGSLHAEAPGYFEYVLTGHSEQAELPVLC